MNHAPRLFVALDMPDLAPALDLAQSLRGAVDGFKLGLEFFSANGPEGVRRMAALGLPIFLDVKFFDIPNTVAGAMRAVAGLGVALITVHAAGGSEMIAVACQAGREGAQVAGKPPPAVVGVTVLTSLGAAELARSGCPDPVMVQAERLALLAMDAGAAGVVCSGHEAAGLRLRLGPKALLVVPGIRPQGVAANDQQRIVTVDKAVAAGADLLVVGRPVTQAQDPVAAASRLRAQIMEKSP